MGLWKENITSQRPVITWENVITLQLGGGGGGPHMEDKVRDVGLSEGRGRTIEKQKLWETLLIQIGGTKGKELRIRC